MRLLKYIVSALILLGYASFVAADTVAPAPQSMEQKLEKTRALMQESHSGKPQAAPEDDLVATSGVKMLQSLTLLVGLVLVGAWSYKKYVLKDVPVLSRKMKLLERITIAPRASLILTEVDGNKILVGLTADSISMMKLGSAMMTGNSETIKLTEEI